MLILWFRTKVHDGAQVGRLDQRRLSRLRGHGVPTLCRIKGRDNACAVVDVLVPAQAEGTHGAANGSPASYFQHFQ